MSDAIKKLEERVAALEQRIETLRPQYLATPDLLKAEYEGLNRQLEDTSAQLNRALAHLAINIQEISTSLHSSSSSISLSCQSAPQSGRCATGRHSNRPTGRQTKFSKGVRKRDQCCVATGKNDTEGVLVAAHIVPLDAFRELERQYEFSPVNGVLMLQELENDYDLHKWYFKEDGSVIVQFKKWGWKQLVKKVNMVDGPNAPSPDLIRQHNQMAINEAQHNCPECWKCVGKIIIESHQKGSCEGLNIVDEEDDG